MTPEGFSRLSLALCEEGQDAEGADLQFALELLKDAMELLQSMMHLDFEDTKERLKTYEKMSSLRKRWKDWK